MRHPKAIAWEKKLKKVFDEIDVYLESTYGKKYTLHPARAKHGTTGNREHDGLFQVGAAFSAGYGSKHGRGYIIETRMVTLDKVPVDVREDIEEEVVRLLEEKLPTAFPDRDLDVNRDGGVYKIHGDLGLGSL